MLEIQPLHLHRADTLYLLLLLLNFHYPFTSLCIPVYTCTHCSIHKFILLPVYKLLNHNIVLYIYVHYLSTPCSYLSSLCIYIYYITAQLVYIKLLILSLLYTCLPQYLFYILFLYFNLCTILCLRFSFLLLLYLLTY